MEYKAPQPSNIEKDGQTNISYENALLNILSDEERDNAVKEYDVNESAKDRISKRNGIIYFGELPIDEWFKYSSTKGNNDTHNNKEE